MSKSELQRIKVIDKAVAGQISTREAAEYLHLSERQVKRLKQNHKPEVIEWVYHGNRGRAPANAIAAEIRQQVLDYAKGKYTGFNDTHLHEKLTKVEGPQLSR